MNIRYLHRFLVLLTALCCIDVQAFQLGQLETISTTDEAFVGEITTYGMIDQQAPKLTAIPEIGARREVAEFVRSLEFEVIDDAQPRLRVTSPRAPGFLHFSFRLKVETKSSRTYRRYTALPLPPRARPRNDTQVSAAQSTDIPAPMLGEQYGPVRVGETLWPIALTVSKKSGAPIGAVIQRIVQTNPGAFIKGDANRLIAGRTLMIPSAWGEKPIATRSAANGPSPGPTSRLPKPSSVDDKRAAKLGPDWQAKQTAIATRIAEVSDKFAKIKAVYAERDQQRAEQRSARELRAETTGEPSAQQAAKVERREPLPTPTAISTQETPAALAPATQPTVDNNAANAAESPPIVSQAPTRSPGVSLTQRIMVGTLLVMLALALLAGLSYLALRARMSRRHRQEAMVEADLRATISAKAKSRLERETDIRAKSKGRRAAPTKATVKTTAKAAEDPARDKEVEIFIAHGRYVEAKRVLNEVIAKAPNNYLAKLKLAEVHYLNDESTEFAALARELHSEYRSELSDEQWQKLTRMGKAVAADLPIFSGPAAVDAK
ncbi:MAG: hypothetical protein AAF384_05005 [Pseudomonadota bacterium]